MPRNRFITKAVYLTDGYLAPSKASRSCLRWFYLKMAAACYYPGTGWMFEGITDVPDDFKIGRAHV